MLDWNQKGGKMALRTIEIICLPCPKCENLRTIIHNMIKSIETEHKIKVPPFEIKHTQNLQNLNTYSLNPAQLPAIIINGNLEIAGKIDPAVLKIKIEAIRQS